MFLLRRPSDNFILSRLSSLGDAGFSYPGVGMTQTGTAPPKFFLSDSMAVHIGNGPAAFEAAKSAIKRFEMFPKPLTEVFSGPGPIAPGKNVLVLIRHLGIWSLNPARVIYVIEEQARFGFAYGTLRGHAEAGEELFLVTIDPNSGAVRYDLRAVSRPASPLAFLGFPVARFYQAKFRRESAAAMKSAAGK